MTPRSFVVLLLLLLLPVFAGTGSPVNKPLLTVAGPVQKAPLQICKDSSNIQPNHFDQDALNQFRKNPDFNYNDSGDAGEPSYIQKFWMWLKHVLFGWMRNARIDGTWTGFLLTLLRYLIYAAAVALLVFVIVKAIGIDPINLFRGKSRLVDNIPYTESAEDINIIDFEVELEKALSKNNYRLAVRLLYLGSLKQLSDLQLIDWQIDKTNAAYVQELTDPLRKHAFSLITRQFEYVWYGNFNIDKNGFANIRRLFQDFKQQLS